jgi:hypothetical protein
MKFSRDHGPLGADEHHDDLAGCIPGVLHLPDTSHRFIDEEAPVRAAQGPWTCVPIVQGAARGGGSALPASFPLRDAGKASAAGTTKRLLTTCQCDASAARSLTAAGAVLRTGLQAEPCANVSARRHLHGWSLAGRLRDRAA